MSKHSVLMPVYNESRTLDTIVGKVLEPPLGADLEPACVNDWSSEDSPVELIEPAESAEWDPRIRRTAQPTDTKGHGFRSVMIAARVS
jgi:hypothetical protein